MLTIEKYFNCDKDINLKFKKIIKQLKLLKRTKYIARSS